MSKKLLQISRDEVTTPRIRFSTEDVEMLIELLNKHSKVLNQKNALQKSSRIEKYRAWEKITASYNSLQTAGVKTTTELQTKYKNLKRRQNESAANEKKKALKKTLGDSGSSDLSDGFDFVGVPHRSDSDSINDVPKSPMSGFLDLEEVSADDDDELYMMEETTNFDSATAFSTKISHKEMKMSSVKNELLNYQIDGIQLDNELKKLDMANKQLDLESKKLDMESKTLEIESKKLDLEFKKMEMKNKKLLQDTESKRLRLENRKIDMENQRLDIEFKEVRYD